MTIIEWLFVSFNVFIFFLSLYSTFSFQAVSTVTINKYHVVSICIVMHHFKNRSVSVFRGAHYHLNALL